MVFYLKRLLARVICAALAALILMPSDTGSSRSKPSPYKTAASEAFEQQAEMNLLGPIPIGHVLLAESEVESSWGKTKTQAKTRNRKAPSKRRSKVKSAEPKKKSRQEIQYALGAGLTTILTPSFGVSFSAKGFEHFAASLEFGGGEFDTSSYADEGDESLIKRSFSALGLFYYPSFKRSFYVGSLVSFESIRVDSIAEAEQIDLDNGTIANYELPQITEINSTYLIPAAGFYNKFGKFFFSDFRFGVEIPVTSEVTQSADRSLASGLGAEEQDVALKKEKDDIVKFLGGPLPYLSLVFGAHYTF